MKLDSLKRVSGGVRRGEQLLLLALREDKEEVVVMQDNEDLAVQQAKESPTTHKDLTEIGSQLAEPLVADKINLYKV